MSHCRIKNSEKTRRRGSIPAQSLAKLVIFPNIYRGGGLFVGVVDGGGGGGAVLYTAGGSGGAFIGR